MVCIYRYVSFTLTIGLVICGFLAHADILVTQYTCHNMAT